MPTITLCLTSTGWPVKTSMMAQLWGKSMRSAYRFAMLLNHYRPGNHRQLQRHAAMRGHSLAQARRDARQSGRRRRDGDGRLGAEFSKDGQQRRFTHENDLECRGKIGASMPAPLP